MEKEDVDMPLFNKSLAKSLAVLRAFTSSNRTMNLGEVASNAEISKSSAQRIVFTLETLGYLRKHPRSKRFELAPRVLSLGCNYLEVDQLIDCANPFLASLSAECDATVAMTEPDGLDMLYVARFPSHKHIPIHIPLGSRFPMYCTASGRAFLSAQPHDTAVDILTRSDRVALTPNTCTDLPKLIGLLQEARERGFALNIEELFIGDLNIAAPITNARGQSIASVHVAAPTSRWTVQEVTQKLAPLVIECARSISNAARTLD